LWKTIKHPKTSRLGHDGRGLKKQHTQFTIRFSQFQLGGIGNRHEKKIQAIMNPQCQKQRRKTENRGNRSTSQSAECLIRSTSEGYTTENVTPKLESEMSYDLKTDALNKPTRKKSTGPNHRSTSLETHKKKGAGCLWGAPGDYIRIGHKCNRENGNEYTGRLLGEAQV